MEDKDGGGGTSPGRDKARVERIACDGERRSGWANGDVCVDDFRYRGVQSAWLSVRKVKLVVRVIQLFPLCHSN